VAEANFKPGKQNYLAPLAFGGVMLGFVLARCVLLGRHPKRSDIVRGESGPSRPRRKSPPVAKVMLEELEKRKKAEKLLNMGRAEGEALQEVESEHNDVAEGDDD